MRRCEFILDLGGELGGRWHQPTQAKFAFSGPGGVPCPPTGYPGEEGGGGVGREGSRTELLLSKLLDAVCSLPVF